MWATYFNLHNRRARREGFTIVELLIVIVVIAILAAITIVAYNGIQDRARSSAAASSSSQAAKKIKVWQVDNELTSPTCAQFYILITNLSGSTSCSFDYKDTNYQYTAYAAGAFCVTTTVVNKSYKVTESSTPQTGGCAGHGQGGVAAVTNLATDPRATSLTGALGWNNGRWFGTAPAAGTNALITGASDGPAGIATYLRKTWSTAPAAISNSGDTGFGNYLSTSSALVVAQDEVYTISCYLRPSVARNFNIGIYQYTSAGAAFTTPRVAGPTTLGSANQWTRVSYTYTVPSGVGKIGIVCDSNSNPVNGAANWAVGSTLDGTGLMVTQGATLYQFADGDSSNWVWNGTPNNATSTGLPL